MQDHEAIRQRHVERFFASMGDHIERVTWPRARLDDERDRALRALVATAKARSPWHAQRLADVDVETLRVADLQTLPTMTKDDVMANFDEVATDRRVTLQAAEAHLRTLRSGDDYLLEEFHVVASAGSSGRRGVFVWGWDAWAEAFSGFSRAQLRDRLADPDLAAAPNVVAVVAAEHASHMSSALSQTFRNPFVETRRFPITMPVAEIVAGLNALQPPSIMAYASALAVLLEEARAGRLRIAPKRVIASSEPMPPGLRAAVAETWGAPVANWWAASEAGPLGVGCFQSDGMHLCEDLNIVEPVDEDGRPVPPGVPSSRIYVTNLVNHVQPLIRYELTDEITVLDEPCACGSAHRRLADIEGRRDEAFAYGDVLVHAHLFRSALARASGVIDYQVRQTEGGADVFVIAAGAIDAEAIEQAIVEQLARVGVPGARVRVLPAPSLERGASGKLKRCVPLGARA